jgi:hypothetical protein
MEAESRLTVGLVLAVLAILESRLSQLRAFEQIVAVPDLRTFLAVGPSYFGTLAFRTRETIGYVSWHVAAFDKVQEHNQ